MELGERDFGWDQRKNEWLKAERGISFDDIVSALESGGYLATILHPNRKRYQNQKIYVVAVDGYAYLVPFVEDKEKTFLKTIFPSRKATRDFITKKLKLEK